MTPAGAADEQPDTVAARAAMVDALITDGTVNDPRIENALRAVRREALVPQVIGDPHGLRGPVLADTPTERAAWLGSVYANRTLLIETHTRAPRTSGTQPGLMAIMLDALALAGDETILEIGTGTGYTTALLVHLLGDDRVRSMDIEPDLVRDARRRLTGIGCSPSLRVGNGADGWPSMSPFDRVLGTCAVRHIPPAWLAQLTDSGRIVTPLRGGLAIIDRHGHGRFHPRARPYFMPLRSPMAKPVADKPTTGQPRQDRQSALGPFETFYQDDVRFMLDLALPGLEVGQHAPGMENLSIHDALGNEARLHPSDEHSGRFRVEEFGARSLWRDVEAVTQLWVDRGRPGRDRYGISVRPGNQTVWLDAPEGPSWELGA